MKHFPPTSAITPTDFELHVKRWFESVAGTLDSFEATHLESMEGKDGEFAIDVTVRFTAFGGAKFLVLCECKKHSHPIKREIVQVLHDKMRSIGAQKGFVVSTAPFQSGAQEYARAHGIALVELARGTLRYVQNSTEETGPIIPDSADTYVGFFPCKSTGHGIWEVLISSDHTYWLERFLQFPAGTEYAEDDSPNTRC